MIRLLTITAACASAWLACAQAGEEVFYGAAAPWVQKTAAPAPDPNAPKTALRILLTDSQTKFTETYSEIYTHAAAKLQTPEGLAAGNIQIMWNPETTDVTIHEVKIIRDGAVIDLLAEGQRFEQFRREPYLEAAILDGVLTAALQPAGLRIGDIIEYSYTQKVLNPIFDGASHALTPNITSVEASELHLRYLWPESKKMQWQTTDDLPKPRIRKTANGRELELRLKNTKPETDFPINAPGRYYLTGMLELSDIEDWSRISKIFWPHFEKASGINPASPLAALADKIARETDDPLKRTEKALRVVQDDVRYVFLGMDAGAYRPATAEETWMRRYGDCKGKTTLLLALLHALGVEAEAVLVSSMFDDGLDRRLPNIGLFDHVLVRARIKGQEYWLDGTRSGDRELRLLTKPFFQWSLPLRENGASLDAHTLTPADMPTNIVMVDIDASKGLEAPAPFSAKLVIEGDAGIIFKKQLEALTGEQAEEAQKALWDATFKNATYDNLNWQADDGSTEVELSAKGEIKIKPHKRKGAVFYDVPASKIGWDVSYMEKAAEARTAPWLLPFPIFVKLTTTITLPNKATGFSPAGLNIESAIDGLELDRIGAIKDGALVVEASFRTLKPEFDVTLTDDIIALMDSSFNELAEFKHNLPNNENVASETGGAENRKAETANDYIAQSAKMLEEGKLDEAIEATSKALELQPASAMALANRGMAYGMKNDPENAARDLEAALKINPRNWVALHGQGLLKGQQGDFESALIFFDKAISINPADTFAMGYRSTALEFLGRSEEAEDQLRALLLMDPDNIFAITQLARLTSQNGDFEAAMMLLNEKLKHKPEDVTLLQIRSRLYEDAGQYTQAAADLDQTVAIHPDNAQFLNNRCWLRATRNFELDKALADCNAALELQPGAAAFLDSRAMVRMRQGKIEQAIEDYKAALKASPNQANSLYVLGILKIQKGDQSGQMDIDRALEIYPSIAIEYESYEITP